MNTKEKVYWIFQVVGWSAWLSHDLVTYVVEYPEERWVWVLNFIFNVIVSIALTHLYRRFLQKYQWQQMDYRQALVRIGLAAFVMACVMSALNIPFDSFTLEEQTSGHLFSYLVFWGKPMTIWLLFYHFYHYFEQTRNIAIEKVRIEALAKETEAKVLRSQLNPHFMFNALNSIRALILEDPDRAQKGITQISNILRNSLLADRRQTVSLSEEMRTVDDYLALEKIRYEDRLEIRKNIYPETLASQIPPMMLQTLVENAIKHGVSKPMKGGFVSIEARTIADRLTINISNTGILEGTDSGGFGLKNTERRLKLLFGEGATFRIFQSAKEVVSVEISIPSHAPVPKQVPIVMKKV